jgi:hypothetical protein
MTRAGHREDERTGAKVAGRSPNHGDSPRSKRTRASRVGVETDAVRIRRLGRSLPDCERGRIETSSGCPARGRSLSKPKRRGRAPGSRVKNGRTQKCVRTELAARTTEARRRCSRATKALRDRVDREWLFQRVFRLRARYREEGRHPRRGAPKCGAGVAVEGDASRLHVRWSRAGRRAITECITHRIDRSGRGRGDTFIGLRAPPPRRLPRRANGEWTRSKEARPREHAGRRAPFDDARTRAPILRGWNRVVTVRGRASPGKAHRLLGGA